MKRIFFNKEWPKLKYPLFCTLRLDKGTDYYQVGKKYECWLGSRYKKDEENTLLCNVELVGIRYLQLGEVSPDLAKFDANMTPIKLYRFMEKTYGKNDLWAGRDTRCRLLFFLKVVENSKVESLSTINLNQLQQVPLL